MKKDKIDLLQCFQNEEDKAMNPAKKFVQTIIYPGKDSKSIAETRSQMYEKQKQKSSSNLIPDQSSLHGHLKRAKLQTMTWNQCCEENILYPDPIDYGWIKEDVLKPSWFEVAQLSPSLPREKKKRKRKEADHIHEYEADTKEFEVEEPAQKRVRRNSPTQIRPVSNGSEADVLESVVDTGNTSGLTTTTYYKSDAFDDDGLSSLSDLRSDGQMVNQMII